MSSDKSQHEDRVFQAPKTLEQVYDLQRRTTALLQANLVQAAEKKLCPPSASDAQRKAILSHYSNQSELIAAVEPITEATRKNYRRQGRRALLDAKAAGVGVWELIESRAKTRGSWYTFKASMQFYLREEMSKAKADLDKWTREVGSTRQQLSAEVQQNAKRAMSQLPELARELATVPEGLPAVFKAHRPARSRSQPDDVTLGQTATSKRGRRSKSSSLKGLPADWREQMADVMPPSVRLLWLMQCVTGCRSQELMNGVTDSGDAGPGNPGRSTQAGGDAEAGCAPGRRPQWNDRQCLPHAHLGPW
jgi:hypothetical protein